MKKFNNTYSKPFKKFYKPNNYTGMIDNNPLELDPAKVDNSKNLLASFTGKKVIPYPGEEADSLIKRFRRAVEAAGVISDLKKREYYKSAGVRNREKKLKAQKRARKNQARFPSFDRK